MPKPLPLKEAIASYLMTVKALCPKVTEAELNYLKSGLAVAECKAKDFFIQAGAMQKEIGFVCSGLLRAYYVDHNGDDISVKFIREGGYATDYSSFLSQTPSKYTFQCLEASTLLTLRYEHIQEGYEKFPNLDRYGRLIAEEVLKTQQTRIESFLFDNAETRYLDFIKAYPDIFNRVSLSYLASYLGIERQTLTRIRQKLARRAC
jgi:CRP/FNR family transcriptional regulator